jgi:hypothetical protein
MDKNNAAAIPPLTAPAMLTDEQILTALASIAHEVPARLPPGWSKFARAIEREVAKAAPAAPVQTAQDCMECGGSGEMFGGFYCDECNGSGKVAAPVQTEKAINMNTMTTVTLTAFGANERNWHYAWMRDQFPDVAPAQSKAGDVLTEPLWELFKIFGRNMGPGMPEVPFKNNEITLAVPVQQAEPIYQAGIRGGWEDVEKWQFELYGEKGDGAIKTRIVYAAPIAALPAQAEQVAAVRAATLESQAQAIIGFAQAAADCGLVPLDSIMRLATGTADRIRALAAPSTATSNDTGALGDTGGAE